MLPPWRGWAVGARPPSTSGPQGVKVCMDLLLNLEGNLNKKLFDCLSQNVFLTSGAF